MKLRDIDIQELIHILESGRFTKAAQNRHLGGQSLGEHCTTQVYLIKPLVPGDLRQFLLASLIHPEICLYILKPIEHLKKKRVLYKHNSFPSIQNRILYLATAAAMNYSKEY